MRPLLILILALGFCSSSALGQDPTYCQFGVAYGTHISGYTNASFIFRDDHILSIDFCAATHRSPGIPSDYQPGIFTTNPQQYTFMMGALYGRVLFTSSPAVRFVLAAGPAIGLARTASDFEHADNGLFASNYTFSHSNSFVAGLLMHPSVQWLTGQGFGLSAGIYANINTTTPGVGADFSMLIGDLKHQRSRRR
jgi:hypothetical protein